MKRTLMMAGLVAAAATATGALMAADHDDSPAAGAEPTADITDVYAWMTSDASKVNLVMDVAPFATAGTQFGTAVTYALHVNSSAGYGMPQQETQVLCQFYDYSKIECWAGDEYVEGDPSATSGISSSSGKLKVFAGLRNDPFYMEFVGFSETVKAVVAAAPSLNFDADGCPALDSGTSAALVGQLQSGMNGAAASDTFAGSNVLALVVQIDKTVVNGNGPVLAVWGSTHTAN
jgi:hypothetical protein